MNYIINTIEDMNKFYKKRSKRYVFAKKNDKGKDVPMSIKFNCDFNYPNRSIICGNLLTRHNIVANEINCNFIKACNVECEKIDAIYIDVDEFKCNSYCLSENGIKANKIIGILGKTYVGTLCGKIDCKDISSVGRIFE